MNEMKIKQSNMLCHRCLLNIAKSLEQINGIVEFDIDLDEQYILVRYSNDELNEVRIKQILDETILSGKVPFDLIGDYSKGSHKNE